MENNPFYDMVILNTPTDVVDLLLYKGASIQTKNKYDNTPLYIAAWSGHSRIVGLILEGGPPLCHRKIPQYILPH